MKIDFANLQYQYQLYKKDIDAAIQGVLDSSKFIMGPQVKELEDKLADFTNAKHCITCSSGTDALQLAMMALGVGAGDEVITTPFTFIATAEMIAQLGARPVFVDIDPVTYNLDTDQIGRVVSEKSRAIIPVGLYGQPADMNAVNAVAKKHGLAVIEDAAQSFGATYRGSTSCNLSTIGCTSFFPAKPLGCYGDGGAVFTSDDGLADKIRSLRVHGQGQRYEHQYVGLGARLDTMQAAVLLAKLPHYPEEIEKRQEVAEKYTRLLGETLTTPQVMDDRTSVWAQYSVQVDQRDELRRHLSQAGVPTAVHYPRPLHLQACFAYLGYGQGDFPVAEQVSSRIMSLPMNAFLTTEEQKFVSRKIGERLNNSLMFA
ncbi:MAG: DegT/DnrJ/EryC1/StrS family aminotransferase [Desulfovermiculus sp.]